jgi:alkanesulfonate monooxygenase SsuD/methylene tetrahydromethanopterin reductase-like flavin-dependent oxidoreductase (luciferase family)
VWAWSPAAYAEKVAALRTACEREGRDPGSVRLSLGLSLLLGDDERDLERRLDGYATAVPGGVSAGTLDRWREERLAGTSDEILERLAAFAEIGVEEVIVSPGAAPFAVHDPEAPGRFAADVIPRARDL